MNWGLMLRKNRLPAEKQKLKMRSLKNKETNRNK